MNAVGVFARGGSSLAPPTTATLITNIINLAGRQQIRCSSRKTFALQYRYGEKPLYNQDRYDEAQESGRLEELRYKTIRFPTYCENSSVFHDDLRLTYVKLMMRDGRFWLMDQLVHEGFYEIKLIQYRRRKKQLERKAARAKAAKENDTQSDGKTATAKVGQIDGREEEEEIETNPLNIFKKAIENAMPSVVTEKIRRGGAIYQVPIPVEHNMSLWLAMRWYNDTIKDRPKPREKHFPEVFAQEMIDGSQGRGLVVKKRDDVHRLAHANKAYAHYRWG